MSSVKNGPFRLLYSTFDIRHSALLAALFVAAESAPTLEECAAVNDATARLACYDRLAGRPAATPEPTFGMKPAPKTEPEALRSRLVGKFEGWERGTEFRLENGQVWKAVGDDRGYYPGGPEGAAVTITKNFFGAYWMEVEAVGRRVKVRRVR